MIEFSTPRWAHAEVYGHSNYYCRAEDATYRGAPGVAIEPMTVDGLLPALFVPVGAIFRMTPMSENDVRHAALPRAYRACETFQASGALPSNCRVCGRNEQEHVEEQQRKAQPILSERALSVIPDALFEEGDGQDDDIPFDEASRIAGPGVPQAWRSDMSDEETIGVFEDEWLINTFAHHIRTTPRQATEALAVMLRSGHDKIELIRAPLACSGKTDEPLGDRARKALEGTPVANADLLAATLRASIGVVSAMLEEMGWESDGHGLWMRPEWVMMNCKYCGARGKSCDR